MKHDKRKYTQEENDKIVNLYTQELYNIQQIIKLTKLSSFVIKKILLRNNIKLRNSGEGISIGIKTGRLKLNNVGKNNSNYGKHWSNEQKQKASERQKKAFENPEFAQKMQKAHWVNDPIMKEKMSKLQSELMAEKISTGKIQINTGYKVGWFKSEKMDGLLYYMSGMELKRFQILEASDLVKNFTNKHGIKLSYVDSTGVNRKYIPDLLIEYNDETKILEEIKGRIVNQTIFEIKNRVAQQYCEENNMKYRIIYKQDIKKV